MGREMALQMLYQSDLGGASALQVMRGFNPSDLLDATREDPETDRLGDAAGRPAVLQEALAYARRLVQGTLDHQAEVDGLIRGQAENWRLERMSVVDRNVLRLAVYELLYEPDVPQLVILDEAIELAKRFGSEQSGRFVNGVLDGLVKGHQFPGATP
ncbi:MAG TPA: transcription antitermination factor NusB [Thermoanaerobaculia bacterium]|nr:transcription antitermination factor NusB [Thermoanaerobaculia bacterium]